MGLRYSDIETFVREGLVARGYGSANPDTGEPARTMPLIDPGPPTVERLTKQSPSTMLFLTLGGGVGLAKEGLFDMPFVTVRTIGLQGDHAFAETLAYDVDDIMLAVSESQALGTGRVLFINRTSGAPQLIDLDSADRYHYQTTYIVEAQR